MQDGPAKQKHAREAQRKNPFISRNFYAIRPVILWHILGIYFLLIWGVGVVRIVFISDAGGVLQVVPGELLPSPLIPYAFEFLSYECNA